MTVEEFIERWESSAAAERSNYTLFLSELCDLLGVERPNPATKDRKKDNYVYERDVTDPISGNTKYIDLYKQGCFVLEAKQGSEKKAKIADPRQLELVSGEAVSASTKTGTAVRGTPAWAKAMVAARQQAYNYATMLHAAEGWPPFLIVVDVGHVIELYADFSGVGKNYTQFQDGSRFRITLKDLRQESVRETLRLVWTDPHALDPAKKTAKVTRKIADQLAALGKSFEEQGHKSDIVARFLMRCLFTMFAEDVELIPKDSFTKLLVELRGNPKAVQPTLQDLWKTMNDGGFSPVLRHDLLRFNGGLFAEADALPVNSIQLGLLIAAAEADWREVEPAIFGTLLERALSPKERHKLGAHYTPRAYVERLVTPTIVEPLRADWDAVKAAAFLLVDKNKTNEAIDTVRKFHRDLCAVRVLDPACGSGNFLYVAMEQMKRLEGEVIGVLRDFGFKDDFLTGLDSDVSEKLTVDPHQFLGIEINPWAAAVAELVLWIGYLQWHFKTFGKATPAEPVLRDFHNIECRDALLVLEGAHPRMDENGKPVTRWDGETMRRHPATGEMVPDPDARIDVMDYESAKPADWPQADFIVGNPPFIGASRMRDALGDGYVETLWETYPKMPQSADFVMFWWDKAARRAQIYAPEKSGGLRRFGFITTNSLRQTFNRRVLEPYLDDRKKPISLLFAIPDHPWVDSQDGAAVRIAMTVAAAGRREGRLLTLESEKKTDGEGEGRIVTFDERRGKIFANLQTGVDPTNAKSLRSNNGLSTRGIMLFGQGFLLSENEADDLRPQLDDSVRHRILRPYQKGKELFDGGPRRFVLDCLGFDQKSLRLKAPAAYQYLYDKVKPERDRNNRKSRRERWWLFGEALAPFRPAWESVPQIIVTMETSKHRIFQFLSTDMLPDNALITIALEDAGQFALLSSRIHVTWALAAGGRLGVGNDPRYNKSKCFDPFPFPDCTPEQTERLRDLGERLDAHRKARQAEHPRLTLTQMYNVLERLREIEASRSGEVLDGKDKQIYEQGQIGLLKDLHDQIDAAVADAYGWPADLADEEILERLVALNRERHLEEIGGKIRWLRPDYQNPTGADAQSKSGDLELDEADTVEGKQPWPKALPQQMAMVRDALTELGTASVKDIQSQFRNSQAKTIRERLETLAALGQASPLGDDRYAA